MTMTKAISEWKAMPVFFNEDGKHIRKARSGTDAYLVVSDVMFGGETETRVLKNNQQDTLKQYATAFCTVGSPATHGGVDMGDTYWEQIYHGTLVEIDGRVPTVEELNIWHALRAKSVPSGW